MNAPTKPPPPLRRVCAFVEGFRYVVELVRPNGKRVWVEGATSEIAEQRAAEEIHAADRREKP